MSVTTACPWFESLLRASFYFFLAVNDNEGKDILAESGEEPENPFLDSDQPEDSVDPFGPDQLNPADPLDPPNPSGDESSVDTDQVDAEENPVDTMVTKEPMSEIIKNEEVYLAQEQDDQVPTL